MQPKCDFCGWQGDRKEREVNWYELDLVRINCCSRCFFYSPRAEEVLWGPLLEGKAK